MPLKFKYTGKDQIPAEQQALYVEREGAFYLDVDSVVEKAKADELRAHNIELNALNACLAVLRFKQIRGFYFEELSHNHLLLGVGDLKVASDAETNQD